MSPRPSSLLDLLSGALATSKRNTILKSMPITTVNKNMPLPVNMSLTLEPVTPATFAHLQFRFSKLECQKAAMSLLDTPRGQSEHRLQKVG